MICGVCGGEVRGYRGVLHGRPIKDWKHRTVPPGTEPHRPVLGTPVDAETLDRIHRPEVEDSTTPATPRIPTAPPLVPPRPVKPPEMPQSVGTILALAADHRWQAVEPPMYFQTAQGVEHVVVKMRRRDLGFVAAWLRSPRKADGQWRFESGYSLARATVEQVSSKQLKDWITQRQEWCPDCGVSSVIHDDEECGGA